MFPLAVMLAVASFFADARVWRYALPIAMFGWLIAAYHMLLYAGIIPAALEPCGDGPSCSSANMRVLGFVPIPLLSLAAFSAIAALLEIIRRRSTA
jgi:disulfide bond formation protein DsbB